MKNNPMTWLLLIGGGIVAYIWYCFGNSSGICALNQMNIGPHAYSPPTCPPGQQLLMDGSVSRGCVSTAAIQAVQSAFAASAPVAPVPVPAPAQIPRIFPIQNRISMPIAQTVVRSAQRATI